MKRYGTIFILCIAIAGGAAAQSLAGRTMYVAVKNVELKSSAGFFSETIGILEYGEQVTVLKENGKWVEVRWTRRSSVTGWMASAGLTTKRIVSNQGNNGRGSSASASELALAGKGFSAEVERSYQTASGGAALNYSGVDALEALTVTGEELRLFLVEGHLFLGDK